MKWFQAMFLVTQSKNSISSLELSRQLGVKYDSAWLMRQKLNAVMQADEAKRKLDGRIEMDDAVLGGEKGELDCGKRGRGGPNKVPPRIAVFKLPSTVLTQRKHSKVSERPVSVRSISSLLCAATGSSASRCGWPSSLVATATTCHAIRRPYVPRVLAEFQWRFNRRADMAAMLDRLLDAAVRHAPKPYLHLRLSEMDG